MILDVFEPKVLDERLQGKTPPDLKLPLAPLGISLPQGNFNISRLYETLDHRPYILRLENPEGRARELPYVTAEYQGVGFLSNPQNSFRIRTPLEQMEFAGLLRQWGIPAVESKFAQEDIQIITFIPDAQSLAELWGINPSLAIRSTYRVISTLMDAHKKGFAIGDRWGPNELVTSLGNVLFVDFDIAIDGPEAREFEMASLMYFITYFAQGTNQNLPELSQLYRAVVSDPRVPYQTQVLRRYIQSYALYFSTAQKYSWTNPADCLLFFDQVTAEDTR